MVESGRQANWVYPVGFGEVDGLRRYRRTLLQGCAATCQVVHGQKGVMAISCDGQFSRFKERSTL